MFRTLCLLMCVGGAAALLPALSHAAGPTIFVDCADVMGSDSFRSLREFYQNSLEELKPQKCAALTETDFLAIVSTTNSVADGMYQYDGRKRNYTQIRSHTYQPVEQFDGPGYRHYALMSGGILMHGKWQYGYELLSAERSRDGRIDVVLQPLVTAHEDPVSGMCGHNSDGKGSVGTASEIRSYKVEKEVTVASRIIFQTAEEDCQSGAKRQIERRFAFFGARLVELEGNTK